MEPKRWAIVRKLFFRFRKQVFMLTITLRAIRRGGEEWYMTHVEICTTHPHMMIHLCTEMLNNTNNLTLILSDHIRWSRKICCDPLLTVVTTLVATLGRSVSVTNLLPIFFICTVSAQILRWPTFKIHGSKQLDFLRLHWGTWGRGFCPWHLGASRFAWHQPLLGETHSF